MERGAGWSGSNRQKRGVGVSTNRVGAVTPSILFSACASGFFSARFALAMA